MRKTELHGRIAKAIGLMRGARLEADKDGAETLTDADIVLDALIEADAAIPCAPFQAGDTFVSDNGTGVRLIEIYTEGDLFDVEVGAEGAKPASLSLSEVELTDLVSALGAHYKGIK